MKITILGIATTLIALAACNNGGNQPANAAKGGADTTKASPTTATPANDAETRSASPIKALAGHYFDMKNALANDDGQGAADAGKAMVGALGKLDTTALTSDQKRVYRDMADDIRENAEHIGANAGKIAHQREHFEMLSKDMYDLIKKCGAGQTVYQDFCPTYNNKKGAAWVSEFKEIKNPYLGKKMTNCGSVKEEIK